jgi:hypothetical protein
MTDRLVRVTYAELAKARGVSIGAARRMAQRHRWPKQVGNDGLSHVSVPATFLIRSDAVDTDVATDAGQDLVVPNDIGHDVANDIEANGAIIPTDVATNLRSDGVVDNDVSTDVARAVSDQVA